MQISFLCTGQINAEFQSCGITSSSQMCSINLCMFVIASPFSAFKISLWILSNPDDLLFFSLLIYHSISCLVGGGQLSSLYAICVHRNVSAGSSQLSKFLKYLVHFFSISCCDVIRVPSSPTKKLFRFLKPPLNLLIFCLVLLSRWF
jgi:hypothetical protein